ncbi:MAG: hypothetical protein RR282_00695 [Acinetobacter sp.]
MDKLKLAHEYVKTILSMNNACHTMDDAVNIGWQYADMMIAEQEKRTAAPDEFQVDWSRAPDWANWWAMDKNGVANWYNTEPSIEGIEWVCGRRGDYAQDKLLHGNLDWRNSLQERK